MGEVMSYVQVKEEKLVEWYFQWGCVMDLVEIDEA